MWVRRQLAAIALISAQLFQGLLPATGAVCASVDATAVSADAGAPVAETGSQALQSHQAHQHHQPPVTQPIEQNADPADDTPATVNCPMAMMCAVAGVASRTTSVSLIDVTIDTHRPEHPADWPDSLDICPEPPPPRR